MIEEKEWELIEAITNGDISYAQKKGAALGSYSFRTWSYSGITPFIHAIKSGKIEFVKFYADNNPEVLKFENPWQNPLFVACDERQRKSNIEIVKYLLSKGVPVNNEKKEYNSPLHLACLYNEAEIVELLLANGADVNARGESNNTPLISAARSQNPDLCNTLIQHGANTNDTNDFDENVFSAFVSWYGKDPELAEFLIRKGADFRKKNKDGISPIHRAAQEDAFEIIEVLIKNGEDINKRSDDKKTPLDYALENSKVNTVKFLVKNKSDFGYCLPLVLELANKKNDVELTELIVHHSDKKSIANNTLTKEWLEMVKTSSVAVVKSFIEKGLDLNCCDEENKQTALMVAAGSGNILVLLFLLESGADKNKVDVRGNSALMHAAYSKQWKTVEELLKFNPDIFIKNKRGMNALMFSCQAGDVSAFRLLHPHYEKNNSAINNKTIFSGSTALIFAVESGSREIVGQLMDGGAEAGIKDSFGKSAIDYAIKNKFSDIQQLLSAQKIGELPMEKPEIFPLFKNWWSKLSTPWKFAVIQSCSLITLIDEMIRFHPGKFSSVYDKSAHDYFPAFLETFSAERREKIVSDIFFLPKRFNLNGYPYDFNDEWGSYEEHDRNLFKIGTLDPLVEIPGVAIIDIRYSYVKFLEPLYGMYALTELRTFYNQVSKEDLKKFQKINPRCKIIESPEDDLFVSNGTKDQLEDFISFESASYSQPFGTAKTEYFFFPDDSDL
jgi:ankyrin repeat protein